MPHPPPLAPEENAYYAFYAVTNLLVWPTNIPPISARWDLAGIDYDATYPSSRIARAILKQNTPFFDRLEDLLRRYPTFVFPPFHSADSAHFPSLRPIQQTTYLLALRILEARRSGRLDDATADCLTALRFCRWQFTYPSVIIHRFMASANLNRILQQIQRLADDPRTDPADLQRLAAALDPFPILATNGAVFAIQSEYQSITSFLDEEIHHEKLLLKDLYETPILPQAVGSQIPLPRYLFRLNQTKQKLADFFRETIDNISRPYADRKLEDLPPPEPWRQGWKVILYRNALGNIFIRNQAGFLRYFLKRHHEYEADLAATRLYLAIRRYERKQGRKPSSLELLVPEYLQSIPADPFDGKPFRYIPERSVLYAVGLNLTDDGGSTNMSPQASHSFSGPWHNLHKMEDRVYPLTPVSSPPSENRAAPDA